MTSTNMQSIIESLTCPITAQIMTDPVSGNDGHTYERAAIMEWLSRNPISPQTRAPMTPQDLTPNVSIRYLLDQYNSGALGAITPVDITPAQVANTDIRLESCVVGFHENKVRLTISTPQETERLPADIILIIDRSGSMNLAVSAKDDTGKNIEDGLSQQDIVNHAANTIVKTLDSNDRLAVIAFDNNLTNVLPLTKMTPMNVSSAMTSISAIKPGGQTNIWLPLDAALKMLDERDDKTRNSAIMLLTDGSPNISPARGEVETLRRLRQKVNFSTPIYTLGFGYALQRGLLYDLAKEGNGNTGHIPDGSMVATVFNNFIGNILCTTAVNIQLYIKTLNGALIVEDPLMGDYTFSVDASGVICVNLGTIQMQQPRDLIINFNNIRGMKQDTPFMEYHLSYKIGGSVYKSEPIQVKKTDIKSSAEVMEANLSHQMRYVAVEQIRKAINHKACGEMGTPCLNAIRQFASHNNLTDVNTQNLLETINDQIALALSDDKTGKAANYFAKWGEFYCDQLSRSLNLQQRCNFKDAAIRGFGGEKFEEIVDHSSDMFDTLPPPVPSLMGQRGDVYNQGLTYRGVATPMQPVRTATYNSQDNPCFTGDCLIRMADGSSKAVKNLVKDDVILSSSDPYAIDYKTTAKIVCVLQTNFATGYANIVNLDRGLNITEWHPIYREGNWIFPGDLKTAVHQPCEAVYSLVLDTNFVAFINDTPCICLGHEFQEGILKHSYFGSPRVIEDMMEMPGWQDGRIINNSGCMIYNEEKQEVEGMKYLGEKIDSLILSTMA